MSIPSLNKWVVLLMLPILFLPKLSWAQLPIAWDAGVFGNKYDEFTDAVEFFDGSFLLGGMTYSELGGDIKDLPRGNGDFFVIRTDDSGHIQWSHLYGGDNLDRMTSLDATPDNGIICVGNSKSGVGGDKMTNNFGHNDYWVVKINDKGDMLWEKSFGGSENDEPYSVKVLPSGEIFILGFSNSPTSGNKTAPHYGSNDFWLVKLDANGNKIWDKSFGGAGDERLYYGALALTNDGHLIIGGSSDSDAGAMKAVNNYGGMDFWVLKLSLDGNIIWEKSYGGIAEEQAQDIIATKDGGYLVGGGTRSNPSGTKNTNFQGLIDFWLLKLDAQGDLVWEKSYGGSGLEVITGLVEDIAGNIMLGGLSDSPIGGTKTAPKIGDYDYWLIFIDKQGVEKWQQTYGGSGKDALTVLIPTKDGGYLVGGDSNSDEGGMKTTENFGFNDYWFFKLECGWDFEPNYSFVGCEGTPLLLDLESEECPNCVFTWPDESVGSQFLYTENRPFGETFSVGVSTLDGCPLTKEVMVTFKQAPTFSLGNDTTVYKNTHVVLRPNPALLTGTFNWSNGDTTLTTLASESGTYGLTIEIDGCVIYEEIRIDFEGNRNVYIPSAFSPNNDGFNDVFRIYADEAIKSIKQFLIFDRWGNQVFELNDFKPGFNSDGWNGTFNGKVIKEGVFIYFIEVAYTDGTSELIKGDITLLR